MGLTTTRRALLSALWKELQKPHEIWQGAACGLWSCGSAGSASEHILGNWRLTCSLMLCLQSRLIMFGRIEDFINSLMAWDLETCRVCCSDVYPIAFFSFILFFCCCIHLNLLFGASLYCQLQKALRLNPSPKLHQRLSSQKLSPENFIPRVCLCTWLWQEMCVCVMCSHMLSQRTAQWRHSK